MKFATVPSLPLKYDEICVVTNEVLDRYRWCWLSLFETYATNQGVHVLTTLQQNGPRNLAIIERAKANSKHFLEGRILVPPKSAFSIE